MALMYTPIPELGKHCPDFSLKSVLDGKSFSLKDFADGKPLAVMFICNHCPYVKAVEDRLLELGRQLGSKVSFVAICSNDSTDYPEDSVENLRAKAVEKNYPFVYLHDADQSVAKTFGAVCTPDFFVYDHHRRLAYRGRLDDSWKDATKVTKQELKAALEDLAAGRNVSPNQQPSMGCSIKWQKISM